MSAMRLHDKLLGARGPDLRARIEGLRGWISDGRDGARAQRAAAGAFVIRVGSAALAFSSQALLARWMGGDEFGIYAYVWTWALLLGSVADFGLGTAAQRFIPQYATNAVELLRGFVLASRSLAVALATLVAVLALGAIFVFAPWLDHGVVLPLCLAVITVPLHALALVQDGVSRSHNWLKLALLPLYIVRPVGMLALMGAGYALGQPATAVTALAAAVIATFVAVLAQLFILDRRLRAAIPPGPRAYAVRTWLATSLPIFTAGGFYFLLTYVDVLVLQHFSPAHDVGLYFAAVKTLALVAFVYFSVSAAVAHRFSEYHAMRDRDRLAAFLAEAIRWTFWPSLAMVCVILAAGRPILWLFGPDYVEAYPLLFVLSLGLLARAAVGPIERLLNMLGEQNICASVYAGAFAFNLLACVVLVPRFGTVGAAVSTAASLAVESIALFVVTKRRLGLHVFVWGGRVPA